jgi:hypothetical protein
MPLKPQIAQNRRVRKVPPQWNPCESYDSWGLPALCPLPPVPRSLPAASCPLMSSLESMECGGIPERTQLGRLNPLNNSTDSIDALLPAASRSSRVMDSSC